MNILKIETSGLTTYYLEQELHNIEKTGLKIIKDEKEDKLEFHYKDNKDLETKLSIIIETLMDK